MLRRGLPALLMAAGIATAAITGTTQPAMARTHVHVHLGWGVLGPYYYPGWGWYGPVYYYPVPYYVPVYTYRPRPHRPRWRWRCRMRRRVVRRWNGHRWVRRVIRRRVCRRVRVW